jgi:hypothetical protein
MQCVGGTCTHVKIPYSLPTIMLVSIAVSHLENKVASLFLPGLITRYLTAIFHMRFYSRVET